MTEPTPDARFSKDRRLLRASEYKRLFDGAQLRASHRHLLLLASTNPGPRHRLGLVIAKKHVRSAVQRNRIKRVTREFFRQQSSGEMTLDVVLLARPGLSLLDNAELSSILRRQWQKLMRHTSEPSPVSGQDP